MFIWVRATQMDRSSRKKDAENNIDFSSIYINSCNIVNLQSVVNVNDIKVTKCTNLWPLSTIIEICKM
jgi:hypothetical protein